MCPADDNYCPSSYADTKINVEISDYFYEREIEWDQEIPNSNFDWHCKYVISSGPSITNKDDENDIGYLYIEGE